MTSYDGFIEFIHQQPANRTILHGNGWCGCAVGDYLSGHEINGHINDWADDIKVDNPELFDILVLKNKARAEFPTYGKLQEWLIAQEVTT